MMVNKLDRTLSISVSNCHQMRNISAGEELSSDYEGFGDSHNTGNGDNNWFNCNKKTPLRREGIQSKAFMSGNESTVAMGDNNNAETSATCTSHRSMSVIGRRREMEDAVVVELGFIKAPNTRKYDFYAVYDGHGGSRVAHVCRDRLHRLLAKEMEREEEAVGEMEMDWEKVMVDSFANMDDEVNESEAVGATGSTAVVAVVGEEVVVVANCGDSRAVMSRGGIAVALSDDHKPDRPDELARIEDSGGRVINWNGQRVLGILATSRSIGDQQLKPYVIAKPEVKVSERSNMDEFLILASDGLWDVISSEVACHVVRKCLGGKITWRRSHGVNGEEFVDAAAVLTELAMARGSRDNISVIVVELNKLGSCT